MNSKTTPRDDPLDDGCDISDAQLLRIQSERLGEYDYLLKCLLTAFLDDACPMRLLNTMNCFDELYCLACLFSSVSYA